MQPASYCKNMYAGSYVCIIVHGRWIDGPPWDDLDNLGHLGHFSVGQVGFIHKINFLDVIGYYAHVL